MSGRSEEHHLGPRRATAGAPRKPCRARDCPGPETESGEEKYDAEDCDHRGKRALRAQVASRYLEMFSDRGLRRGRMIP